MKEQRNQEIGGFLGWVERVGNALPHPAIIFVILSGILIIITHFLAMRGTSVDFFNANTGEKEVVEVLSLLNPEGIRYLFNSATNNFANYAPMPTVLVAMLGVGVAEHSGFLGSLFKKMLSNVNPRMLTATVVFVGIISNIASDAGYVIVIPLGGLIFANAGRHPLGGIAAAFAGVSGGFSANLIVGPTDALLTGITNQAMTSIGLAGEVPVAGNLYFMIASTIFLVIVGTFITERIVLPNLGEYTGTYKPDDESLTPLEESALKRAGVAFLIFAVVMGLLMFGPGRVLQEYNDLTEAVDLNNFLSQGLVFVIMIMFIIPGMAYGKKVGTINDFDGLIEAMSEAMRSMGTFLVLAFFASQFIAYFAKTNLGTVLSVSGAHWLESIGLTALPLIVIFVLLSSFLNLFMGSASAKWAIMAPIFVPMLYQMGISPALTQMAYRIGDSSTNIITPLMTYFAMVVIFANRYDEDSGLGTLISTMIPYSIGFLILWTALLVVWMLVGLPLGPATPLFI